MRILRSIAAVVLGFVTASVVMMLVESVNGRVLYPELAKAAEGVTDREAIRALFAAAPAGALLVVIGGWIAGSFAGGWVAARVSGRAGVRHGLVLGLLLTLAGIANNLMLPPPLWFWVAGLVVMLPAAWAGAKLARVDA
ncbi:MAG: hypothetical protein MUE47_01875 [Acidobacteria bacterium]|nr:hypothetical protein [Acidobacteriota bacterium]